MKRWAIQRYELMKIITRSNNFGGNYPFIDFVTELWPYSPAYHSPFRLEIHKCFQNHRDFQYLPLPVDDNHNWECCHIIKWPSDIYDSLHEVLFRESDIQKYEEMNPIRKISRKSNQHKVEVRKIAIRLWLENPKRTIEEAIMHDDICLACNEELYTKETLRRWIKDLCPNRKPGRRPA